LATQIRLGPFPMPPVVIIIDRGHALFTFCPAQCYVLTKRTANSLSKSLHLLMHSSISVRYYTSKLHNTTYNTILHTVNMSLLSDSETAHWLERLAPDWRALISSYYQHPVVIPNFSHNHQLLSFQSKSQLMGGLLEPSVLVLNNELKKIMPSSLGRLLISESTVNP